MNHRTSFGAGCLGLVLAASGCADVADVADEDIEGGDVRVHGHALQATPPKPRQCPGGLLGGLVCTVGGVVGDVVGGVGEAVGKVGDAVAGNRPAPPATTPSAPETVTDSEDEQDCFDALTGEVDVGCTGGADGATDGEPGLGGETLDLE